MSRFSDDSDDPEDGRTWEMLEQTANNALRSKRGKAALTELREALLALPERKLCTGALATKGMVCAVGSYIAKKDAEASGITVAEAVAKLADLRDQERRELALQRRGYLLSRTRGLPAEAPITDEEFEDGYQDTEDSDRTASAGERAGLTYSLAWQIGYANDELYGGVNLIGRRFTDEERWGKMLAWVDEKLALPPLTRKPQAVSS